MKNKPYLVVYNQKPGLTFHNKTQDEFNLLTFKQEKFNVDLCEKIAAKTENNVAIIIINASVQLPEFWSQRLLASLNDSPTHLCSALTTRVFELSPLVEKQQFKGSVASLDNYIYLLQEATTFFSSKINNECFIVRDKNTLQHLNTISYKACKNLLVQSHNDQKVELTDFIDLGDQQKLPAHPLADLQWKMKDYLQDPFKVSTYPLLDEKPILLHVTMDWGGGVQQWINNYCQNETNYNHLILMSHGEFYRNSHGEKLSLYFQGNLNTYAVEMRRYELQAPIMITAINHEEYRQIFDGVLAEFNIQQIIVSSLIGHSMNCLNTNVATIRVFHDYFPSWPSLTAHLDKRELTEKDLNLALKQTKNEPFGEISKQQYKVWKKELHKAYQNTTIRLVSPSQSVMDNLTKIDKKVFEKSEVIPHAIAEFNTVNYTNKSEKFTILLLGTINQAKGQQLLDEVISSLGEGYHFVLLGAGSHAKKYRGYGNIKIIPAFDNNQLFQLLQKIRPDLALITSQTSETFNYTLSELQQAGICTLSTSFGALKERIIDGETGYHCDSAEAFVSKIQELQKQPHDIKYIRGNLAKIKLPTLADMTKAYRKILAKTQQKNYQLINTPRKSTFFAQNLIDENKEKSRISNLLFTSEENLNDRTRWGKELTKQLKHAEKNIDLERNEIKHLKGVLKKETKRMSKEITSLQRANQSAQQHYETTQKQLQKTEQHYETTHKQLQKTEQILHDTNFNKEKVEQELLSVYQSRSWRMTKPMRTLTTWARHKRNAVKFRLAQFKTFPSRTIRSLKARGVLGTAKIIVNKFNANSPQDSRQKTVNLTHEYKNLTLKYVTKPDVSVIIPVFNHFQHTYNCLKSLAELDEKTTFEVIVVDDCSSDETQKQIKKIKGINYKRQKQNGGFIESCNTGAEIARGKYLMFLNNDTVVYDQWLDSLTEVFDNKIDAGLVGSKLVYPNNQLQEAGGIVFNDASGWNYGRMGNPDEPWYNHVREVDYCSGASILVPKKLFEELGRFDERYKPAYYEDTDLAFAIRNVGKKVYYQPASKITHFEGVSSGTDLTAGMKKYQVVNQTKFKEKWAKDLAKQPKPGSNIELSRIHDQPKRMLILDACTPTPDQDSGSLRMLNLIKILKELDYHIVFMPENLSYNAGYTQALQQLGVECIYHPSINNPVEYLKDKGKYLDAVILSRYYVAEPVMPFIREYCPKAQIIFDTVDLHYVRERRMAELAKDQKLAKIAEETRIKELAVAKACDVTLVVSPYEVEVLAKELPNTKVKVLTNIHEIYGCRKGFKQRKDIMFIGGYQHTPNVDAVEWFIKEIFPLVEKQLPEIKFHIIGSKAPKHIQKMATGNIVFQGFVEDIEPIMDDIRIAVAPLRFGAGVKGKVNMSMSYGQPVVGTKVAVEGMYAQEGVDVLMAETPIDFAQQIVRLYQDEELWNTISNGGLANVQNYFSFEAAKIAIKNILFEMKYEIVYINYTS